MTSEIEEYVKGRVRYWEQLKSQQKSEEMRFMLDIIVVEIKNVYRIMGGQS